MRQQLHGTEGSLKVKNARNRQWVLREQAYDYTFYSSLVENWFVEKDGCRSKYVASVDYLVFNLITDAGGDTALITLVGGHAGNIYVKSS